ncbi:MAG: hypothetical protein JW928_04780 [Candidatus Aureabacteria bacterium]|nr:hypothetical protein [Candidatus Auribacterota bacterium]
MDKEKQIKQYIQKLQDILNKAILDSGEFQKLKRILKKDEKDMHMFLFTFLVDKEAKDFLNVFDEFLKERLVAEEIHMDDTWNQNDIDFLKRHKIVL